MIKKLKSTAGVSLSEMLMVVLILALLVSVLGGGVMVVKNAYEKVILKAEAQTLMSTTITKVKDELRFATYIDNSDPTAPKFHSANMGCKIWFENAKEEDGEKGIMVCAINQRQQLLTDKTQTSQLTPVITSCTYSEAENTFTVGIEIKHGDNASFLTQEINVAPVNEND